ncbi:MAG TPA: hypothetical protein VGR89_07265 [Puia sp.]|nr:hypothetical protein [Puia sp.]
MQRNKEAIESVSPARRRMLARLGLLSFFALVAGSVRLPHARKRNVTDCTPAKNTRMIKMLAEDGTLVEVDASRISSPGRKVSDAELQGWIKK